ncbi:two-component system response regulator [Alteromonas mediterranea]|uniref:Phosphate regulon transcriptional regulatory protein PhoB n=1 Tax=Alteromonas mediterranea TaxID=314275 RepID=A0AAC9J9R5_9ALTE|nr:response regulator transcription factor [Alteromonas mediterranea]APD88916.1 two-component system response regulator [Alteromonas mediterranea]APE00998.1 two-component system response regulator [Alteromonas mediterranea]
MILIIYSGNAFQQNISRCLSKHSFLHDAVSNFQSAESLLNTQHYSLVIIESHASEVCLRRTTSLVKNNPESWVMAVENDVIANDFTEQAVDEADFYEAGVDDYLCGPFAERMFCARIRSHMRRGLPNQEDIRVSQGCDERIEIGPLKVDQRYHSATINGQLLTLTAREFTLLDFFCRHPNQVFTRNQLLSDVWGYNHEGYEHTVNTHINRLRTKLDKVNTIENGGQLVQTVWGVGYRLNINGHSAKSLSA